MTLVDDAKQAWRWLSVQSMVVAGAIQGAWLFLPDDLKTSIPPNIVQAVTLALLGLGIVGRMVKQK
jgi:NO-binding membrane sensor protein with MHYT domain